MATLAEVVATPATTARALNGRQALSPASHDGDALAGAYLRDVEDRPQPGRHAAPGQAVGAREARTGQRHHHVVAGRQAVQHRRRRRAARAEAQSEGAALQRRAGFVGVGFPKRLEAGRNLDGEPGNGSDAAIGQTAAAWRCAAAPSLRSS